MELHVQTTLMLELFRNRLNFRSRFYNSGLDATGSSLSMRTTCDMTFKVKYHGHIFRVLAEHHINCIK